MDMAKGLGLRENALTYCWNCLGMRGEVVWFWEFLSWRKFSLIPAWRGDGCGVWCWASPAQEFGAAVVSPHCLLVRPLLTVSCLWTLTPSATPALAGRDPHTCVGVSKGKTRCPTPISLSSSVEKAPLSCWWTGTSPGLPSSGYHTRKSTGKPSTLPFFSTFSLFPRLPLTPGGPRA